ncbi:MAG: SH3 domain-containing protein [Chloroflexota bacterium]|nr:SH3 domain-containing protein [Chloroflexota bacterium]
MKYFAWLMVVGSTLLLLSTASGAAASPRTQEATVTGTPEGPMILVPEQVNVRTGPSTGYDKVGVLIAGQRAPALGRSPGGEWIQIFYPGVPGNLAWVYAPFVVLDTDQRLLPIIEPPPTPTPRVTATIDPTLAAQFNIGGAPPTRLPTFTPAEPVVAPTFDDAQADLPGGFPPILAIMGLLVVGLFGTVISVLRGG